MDDLYRVWQMNKTNCCWVLETSQSAAVDAVTQALGVDARGWQAEKADGGFEVAKGVVLDRNGEPVKIVRG